MDKEFSKYRLILTITFSLICIANIFLITVDPEMLFTVTNHRPGSEKVTEHNLVFSSDESILLATGLKVETVSIAGPLSFHPGENNFNNLNHQIKLYSKRRNSLISHSTIFISKKLHLSPLITKLQI